MKIGILTWYYGTNYGAKAQAYALQETLSTLGADVYMINYKGKEYQRVNLRSCLDFKRQKKHPFRIAKGLVKYTRFEAFTHKYYHETKSVANAFSIDDLGFDYIVLGSDAIFNIKHAFFNDIYYGVGINRTKKITYAASCEYLSPSVTLTKDICNSLKKMHGLSVRDTATMELIENNTELKPIRVLDPTFLCDFNKFELSYKIETGYILVYSFSEWNEFGNSVKEFAKKHNKKIVAIGRYCDWADISYIDCSVEDWISFFRGASVVFTDSFHGVAFSLKNRKQIILCSRADKRAKIIDLLDTFNIEVGYFNNNESIDAYLQKNYIDYDQVNSLYQEKINFSLKFLKRTIFEGI